MISLRSIAACEPERERSFQERSFLFVANYAILLHAQKRPVVYRCKGTAQIALAALIQMRLK
jgi:hypothetical protein